MPFISILPNPKTLLEYEKHFVQAYTKKSKIKIEQKSDCYISTLSKDNRFLFDFLKRKHQWIHL